MPLMVYAVVNMKGGVAKTTSAVNIAAALGRYHARKALVVDLDSQANATSWLAPSDAYDGPTMAQALADADVTAQVIGKSTAPGVSLAYGSRALADVSRELRANSPIPGLALRNALATVSGDYEAILLDCPPGLDLLSINALIAADELIVPVDSQSMALSGVTKIRENVAELLRAKLLPRMPRIRILLTMYDARLSLDRAVKARIEEIGLDLFAHVIRINTNLAEAYGLKLSIFDYAPASTGAADYGALAALLNKEIGLAG